MSGLAARESILQLGGVRFPTTRRKMLEMRSPVGCFFCGVSAGWVAEDRFNGCGVGVECDGDGDFERRKGA